MKRTETDDFIENRILLGLLVSDDYIRKISEIYHEDLLGSVTARILAGWCLDYYGKYNKAPKSDIQAIYTAHLRSGLDGAEAEIIETLLSEMNEEYDRDKFNVDYLLDETVEYFNCRKIQLLADQLNSVRGNGDLPEAEKTIREWVPLSGPDSLSEHCLTLQQMQNLEISRPRLLVKPWLREGETTILYSLAGVAKTWLALIIVWLLSCEKYREEVCEFGGWQVKSPVGTLYLDGELGAAAILERLQKLEWLGPQISSIETKFFTLPEYRISTGRDFDLSRREDQQKILSFFKANPRYRLLVMDSLSTLFMLEDENSNSEWNRKVQPFLIDLRGMGIGQLILHHSGKAGTQRGASAQATIAANVIHLSDHPQKRSGEAWFCVDFADKQRSGGDSFKKFSVRLIDDGERVEWVVDENPTRSGSQNDLITAQILHGISVTKIAGSSGVHASGPANYAERRGSVAYWMRTTGLLRRDQISLIGYRRGIDAASNRETHIL
jgi:hypothetical protein